MIRRFYIMPVDHGVSDEKVEEFAKVFNDADKHIHVLFDSAAGIDINSRTVIWENNFVDEETYYGPYMLSPYHAESLDKYIVVESPECISHDIFTARYIVPEGTPRLEKGIRRLLLLHIADDCDTSAFEAYAAQLKGIATSVFSPENVVWVSPKGRSCTHVWEQGFTDMAEMDRFLSSPEGKATSSFEGLRRLGADVRSMKVFTYPFELASPKPKPAAPEDSSPIFYSLTARLALEDVDTFIKSIEENYDPFLAGEGTKLVQRWQSVDKAGDLADVQSVWQLDSLEVFAKWRIKYNPNADRFALEGMSLAKGGSRRFYRNVPRRS
jgi:hypothetical protein